MIYIGQYDSPLGRITLAGEDAALTGLWLEGQTHFASTLNGLCEEGWLPVFDDTFRLPGRSAGPSGATPSR